MLLASTETSPAQAAVAATRLDVRDATGRLSDGRVRALADEAEGTLDKILTFWSASPRIEEFGKIRIEFDRPRRDTYSAVFHWGKEGDRRVRIVSVFGVNGEPQMLAHKLTHAVFPNPDKMIRNLMGIPMEAKFGNPLTFPMCGFSNDTWVLALRQLKSYIPLPELGPDHEQWGMGTKGGLPVVVDSARQHAAYAESGSFGTYLLGAYGVEKVTAFNRLSRGGARPWVEAFGLPLKELEAGWLNALGSGATAKDVPLLIRLRRSDAAAACARAQEAAKPGHEGSTGIPGEPQRGPARSRKR